MRLLIAALSMLACSATACADDARVKCRERYIRQVIVTHDVKTVTDDDGELAHIATYPDAVIATQLTGEDCGWQAIFVDGDCINSSDKMYRNKDCYWHHYNFGVVYTYPTYQEIRFY